MGFIEAVRSIGELFLEEGGTDEYSQAVNTYAKLIDTNPEKIVLIRVHLDVQNPEDMPLVVKGVERISTAEMKSIGDEKEIKKKLPYIKTNANATFQLMPMLKISVNKNVLEGEKENPVPYDEIVVEGKVQKAYQDTPIKKMFVPNLLSKFIQSLENEGVIAPGGAKTIYEGMIDAGIYDTVISALSNKEYKGKKFVVVLGIDSADRDFIYPGDIKAFRRYFLEKLSTVIKTEHRTDICPVCGKNTAEKRLSDILKFSSADKPGFFPMMKKDLTNIYVCGECYNYIGKGMEYIEKHLTISRIVGDASLWIIPEIINGGKDVLLDALEFTEKAIREDEFWQKGKAYDTKATAEKKLWNELASYDKANMVYHLVFWKGQQAKVEIRALIEDVPPSRMAMLGDIYKNIKSKLDENSDITFDHLLRDIRSFYLSDLRKRANTKDISFLIDKVLDVYRSLLEQMTLDDKQFKVGFLSMAYGADKIYTDTYQRTLALTDLAFALKKRMNI